MSLVLDSSVAHAWGGTLRLAGRHRLTPCDAACLELALRRAIPLATLDRDLRAAARKGAGGAARQVAAGGCAAAK